MPAQAHLAAIIESADDAIISKSLDGIIETWNPAAESIFGYRADEIVDRSITILIPQDKQDEERDILDRIRRGEHIRHYETIRVRKDGRQIPISLTVSPIKGAQGEIIGASKIARDITERRKMQEELIKAKKLESVALLAGGIAHDFNNLLTGVFGNIALAKLRVSDVVEPLVQAEQTFKRVHDLTNRLLTFSTGGAPVRTMTSVSELLTECASEGPISGIETKLEIADDLWPAEIDARQVTHVIKNLLENARQAMPNRGTVCIEARNTTVRKDNSLGLHPGRYIEIRVKDSGVGIAEENLPQIFDPYFTTKPGATGLGLSVAYSIVIRHGGQIRAESKPAEGCCLTVYLPTQAPNNKTK